MFNRHKIAQTRMTGANRAIVLSLVLTLGSGVLAAAQTVELKTLEPGAKRDNPKARALFDQVAGAYKALKSYSDKGEFILAFKVGDKLEKQVLPMKMTFTRPNKLDFDLGQVRITSDGTTMTTAVAPLKRYSTAPAPKVLGIDAFREGPVGAMIFGGPAGPPMFVLLNLLTSADPAAAIAEIGGTLQAAPAAEAKPADAKAGDAKSADAKSADARPADPKAADPKAVDPKAGKSSFMIEFDKGQTSFVVSVDPTSNLLSSVEMKVDPEKFSRGLPNGQQIAIEQFGWKSGAVATELPKDFTFAYAAPKDYTKVDSLTETEGPKSHPLLGKPALNSP